jgi:hypothetical protein
MPVENPAASNASIFCAFPSSVTLKSPWVRPCTGRPCASVTTTSSTTLRAVILSTVIVSSGAGVCATIVPARVDVSKKAQKVAENRISILHKTLSLDIDPAQTDTRQRLRTLLHKQHRPSPERHLASHRIDHADLALVLPRRKRSRRYIQVELHRLQAASR